MPRLKNTAGAIVSVPQEKVSRLGSGWTRIDGDDPADLTPGEKLSALTVAELTDEVASRNEGRGEDVQIVPESGKKAHLIAALLADDATSAPE